MNYKKLIFRSAVIFLVFLLTLLGVLYYNAVDNSLTQEDLSVIEEYTDGVKVESSLLDYNQQINWIKNIQEKVLAIAPKMKGIPYNQKRELKQLLLAKHGLCYDRSRAIEKNLRYSGFETRHISMYSTFKTGSSVKSLLTKQVSSHAISEVLTRKGWLVVDSNHPWISLDSTQKPVSMEQIQSYVRSKKTIQWQANPPMKLYQQPFTFVYGLYSRHGRFYPPFNSIPDVQYEELLYNW